MNTSSRTWLRTGQTVLKTVIALGLLLAVAWQCRGLLHHPEVQQQLTTVAPWVLIVSASLYAIAQTIWGGYWVRLLHRFGQPIALSTGLRAYFFSQLGKYVPGKAWVIVIRGAIVKPHGISLRTSVLTTIYETFTLMAGGALLAVILLPWLSAQPSTIGPGVIVLLALACIPLCPAVFNRLTAFLMSKSGAVSDMPPRIAFTTLLGGLLQVALGWLSAGLSLWILVHAVVPEAAPLSVTAWLRCLSYTAIAYVTGFVVLFAPGGIGVREYLLTVLLAHDFRVVMPESQATALAAALALLLRLLWTLSEAASMIGLALFALVRGRSALPSVASLTEAHPAR